ncbi:hypothetical protein NE237_032920 [Protea cynaroides]|uniref:Serine-threonine/tyrosine-protein kinase catalytic domain-containing protein n=1 Tax=Protea cynaroides TaxID=273540 RepID=A0A9Q0L3X0_9MAGN|nr:hypothetical protein NE237_032920 [Protea cynaroides]
MEYQSVLAISNKVSWLLFIIVLLLNWFALLRLEAQTLPDEEVQALKSIATKLKNKYWNVSSTSCNDGGLNVSTSSALIDPGISNVTCNCSTATVCHITNIQLKGLNLTGVLPEEFADLPYLQEINLYRNYLNGSIPTSWAQIPLVTIGSIPKEIGDIVTLEELVLEDNELGETLPPELGNLSRLKKFLASANNFTGSIPERYGKLTSLTDLGYMAPEYAMRGYLTDKADVYSFGVVALEIVSGQSNTNYKPREDFLYLLDWAYVLQEQGNLLKLVDPILGSNYSKEEAIRMLNLALLCTSPSPSLRPSMSAVVSMLEGKIAVKAPLVKHSSGAENLRFKSFERHSQDRQKRYSSNCQGSRTQNSVSTEGPWIDSSMSIHSNEETPLHYSSTS